VLHLGKLRVERYVRDLICVRFKVSIKYSPVYSTDASEVHVLKVQQVEGRRGCQARHRHEAERKQSACSANSCVPET
jgi:hypothetical protein